MRPPPRSEIAWTVALLSILTCNQVSFTFMLRSGRPFSHCFGVIAKSTVDAEAKDSPMSEHLFVAINRGNVRYSEEKKV